MYSHPYIYKEKIQGVSYRLFKLKDHSSNPITFKSQQKPFLALSSPMIEEEKKFKKQKLQKKPFTHFLSIPVKLTEIQKQNLLDFHEYIKKINIKGFIPKWIKPIQTLHYTILMLPLDDSQKLDQAKKLLHQLTPKIRDIVQGQNLLIQTNGLNIFGSPQRTRVLYEELDKEEKGYKTIQNLASFLIQNYVERGIIDKRNLDKVKFDKVKQMYQIQFHMTIVNAGYGKGQVHFVFYLLKLKPLNRPHNFDCRQILKDYKEKMNLGKFQFGEIHLSKIGQYDLNGFYHSEQKIQFQENQGSEYN